MAATILTLGWDVASEPVDLPLADGTLVRGTLYSPRRVEGPLHAVVVVHGIAVAHTTCGPGLATPLARNGFLTLAIDVRGHGGSGGTIARSELNDHLAMLDSHAEHPEIDAAIDFLKKDPRIASPEVVVVGHSRGGWAATNVGLHRDDVRGVVCIGAAPTICDSTRPRNFLLLLGGVEDLCPRRKFCKTVAQLTGGAGSPDDTSMERRGRLGEFSDGTVRAWITVPDANHFNEVADDHVTRRTVQWVATAFNTTARSAPNDGLFRFLLMVLVVTLGGFLASVCILSRVAAVLPLASAPRPLSGLVRLSIYLLLLPVLVPVFAATARPLEGGPVCFAVPSVVLFAALSCLGAIVFGIREREERVPFDARRTLRPAMALGAFTLLVAFLWFGGPWGVTFLDLVPTTPRLLLALAIFPLLLPWGVIFARALQRSLSGGLGAALVWVTIPGALVVGHRLFATEGWPLVAVPIGQFTISSLVPLPLWFLPDRKGLAVARGLSHAAGAAWILACHLPFVHAG